MPQAVNDCRSISLTFRDVESLAARLSARGLTKLGSESEQQQRDDVLAAKVIRSLMRSFNRGDVVTLESGK